MVCGKLRIETHPRYYELFDEKTYLGRFTTQRLAKRGAEEYASKKLKEPDGEWSITISRRWAQQLGYSKKRRRRKKQRKVYRF
jgi:hypothetical protein